MHGPALKTSQSHTVKQRVIEIGTAKQMQCSEEALGYSLLIVPFFKLDLQNSLTVVFMLYK